MNVCKVPDMCKDMEYKYITEDSKTRVYLSVVREFNEAEYEKYYIRKKKEKVRKRILFIARALKYALPVLATGWPREVFRRNDYGNEHHYIISTFFEVCDRDARHSKSRWSCSV